MKQEPQAWPLRVEYRQGTQRVWPPYSAVEHRHHHHHHHLLQALPPSRCRRGAMKRPLRSSGPHESKRPFPVSRFPFPMVVLTTH